MKQTGASRPSYTEVEVACGSARVASGSMGGKYLSLTDMEDLEVYLSHPREGTVQRIHYLRLLDDLRGNLFQNKKGRRLSARPSTAPNEPPANEVLLRTHLEGMHGSPGCVDEVHR